MGEHIIEVNSLVKRFGDFTAVDNVSFSVERGSLFGLLGANGAGKTTLIRMLCGLMIADAGSASLAGIDVLKNPEEVKKRIGYMSQRFSLYRDLTADENLEFFGGLYGSRDTVGAAGRSRIFDSVGLTGMENTLAGDLPGGISQRLALACAVSHNPAVLFLDEPTAGVDPVSRRRFWDLIHERAEEGTTVVVTTHYLDEAEYCNDIVLMHSGRIVADGGPDEMKRRIISGPVFEISGSGASFLESVLEDESWVVEFSLFGDSIHIQTVEGMDSEGVKTRLLTLAGKTQDFSIERITPSLEDVFLRIIDQSESEGEEII
ncbi:MAG: ABC transporter ATP-binding protein [Spirochaetes bacterium]|nr:MAG: ABC transporter ATP-binding protein [Spirochaetota bacterium]RKX88748.1 MAG: ABC transporter ATP-binding protein [Spirochaetota bacterium]RKX90831.1 MAG: ABC transporter ATP-binding protein [Spirochaetota bacterium]